MYRTNKQQFEDTFAAFTGSAITTDGVGCLAACIACEIDETKAWAERFSWVELSDAAEESLAVYYITTGRVMPSLCPPWQTLVNLACRELQAERT